MKKLFCIIFISLFLVQCSNDNDLKIVGLTDHQYNYEFQFPSSWEVLQNPEKDEPIRVKIKSPNGILIAVIVSKLEIVNDSPLDVYMDILTDLLIKWTIEQVYRKTFTDLGINKSDIIIRKTQKLSEGITIQFFIDTIEKTDKNPIEMSGLHTMPYKTNHLISMLIVVGGVNSPKKDKDVLTKIMNSFHLIEQ